MILDFDKLRHLSQFSVPLLLAALVVIFFHNGNASFNLQLDADERMQNQQEQLTDIQAIFLDYLIELQNRETLEDRSLPLSVFPEFAPLAQPNSYESESNPLLTDRRLRNRDRPRLFKRLTDRNH